MGGHPQHSRPVPGHRRRPLCPSSPPAPGTGGPAADAAVLLFLPPVLSLVHLHPALYLPALILVLLTPARNSASLPAPPRCLPPMETTTMDPPPEDNRPRAIQSTSLFSPLPTTGGGAQNTAPCHSRDHADALSGTSARSSLVMVILGGGSSGRKRRWWWLPGAEAAAEEAVAR